MRDYEINEKKYYFDHLAFIKLMDARYPHPKNGCTKLSELINKAGQEEYEETNMVDEGGRTVYGWYHKNNGRYNSPQKDELLYCLAKALDVDVMKLLREDPYATIEHISHKNIEDYNTMTPDEILTKVIMSYTATNAYNYISEDSDEDGFDFYLSMVEDAADKIKKSKSKDKNIKMDRLMLCDVVAGFIKSCAYADGLSEVIFEFNPNLKYFTSPYELMEESMEAFVNAGVKYLFIPSMQEIIDRSRYLEKKRAENPDFDDETLFMYELANTVRDIYFKGFKR